MKSLPVNFCRDCGDKNMIRDFDKGVYICRSCDAVYAVMYGRVHEAGTDGAWREELLGEQIK